MTLNFEQFTKAAEIVEKILSLQGNYNLQTEIVKSSEEIIDPRGKKEFYRHMNTLFLNVLLNRLNQVGFDKEQRVLEARKILVDLINKL